MCGHIYICTTKLYVAGRLRSDAARLINDSYNISLSRAPWLARYLAAEATKKPANINIYFMFYICFSAATSVPVCVCVCRPYTRTRVAYVWLHGASSRDGWRECYDPPYTGWRTISLSWTIWAHMTGELQTSLIRLFKGRIHSSFLAIYKAFLCICEWMRIPLIPREEN